MSEQDRRSGGADGLTDGEQEQLVYALESRFASHLEDAASALREAERDLAEAQEQLQRAEQEVADQRYRSDPLVFMRDGLSEELDGLERKGNPKKVRTSYRFLLDRAVELAAGEVQGYRDDRAAEQREKTRGVDASRTAVAEATAALAQARQMQERVHSAEQAARRGIQIMVDKLSGSDT